MRIGYVGELGWELHVPTEYTAHVYEVLWRGRAARTASPTSATGRSTRLRMEKGYLYWSTDITPDTTPLGGRPRAGGSTGTRATSAGATRSSPSATPASTRKLCTFTLDASMALPGQRRGDHRSTTTCVGFTTSANFGHTIGKPIAYGYLPVEHLDRTDFVIEVYGEPIPATRHDGALYDPKGARLRA